jgi:hypothetical protein
MFHNAAPTRSSLPSASPVSNWSVILYRKAEPIHSSYSHDPSQTHSNQQIYGSFYIQLQQQASSLSPSRSDALYLRYQPHQQKNTVDSYTLPFTISQLSDVKLSPDTVPLATIASTSSASSKFYNAEQQTVRKCLGRMFINNKVSRRFPEKETPDVRWNIQLRRIFLSEKLQLKIIRIFY